MRIKKEFKRSKIIILTILVFCILSFHLTYCLAQENNDEGVLSNPKTIFGDAKEMGFSGIMEQRNQFLEERGWTMGISSMNPGGAYFGWGESGINLKPDDKKFGQARITAFYRALAKAKGQFVQSRQQEILTEMAYDFFKDSSPNIESEIVKKEYLSERISILAEKAMDLGEGYLDKLLRELNIDPDNYRKAEKSEKKRIAYEAIALSNTNKAVSSLAGVRVLHSFSDLKAVGVLISYSKGTEGIARQIARGDIVSRRSSEMVTGTIINQLENNFKSDEDYIENLGVRIMEDESGEIALVSFGQWAPAIIATDSDQWKRIEMQSAREIAESNAIAELASFINSTMVFERITDIKEMEELSRITTEKRIEEESIDEIGDFVERIIKQYGRVTLEGITTIKEWATNDPVTGHIIVGSVAMWSPATRDAARGIVIPTEEVLEGKIEYDEKVRQSIQLDHLDPTLRP